MNKIAGVMKLKEFLNSRRAQGLPTEFIVIIVIVVVVLVVILSIFLSGAGQTQTFDQQSVLNTCRSDCFLINEYTRGVNKSAYTAAPKDSGFCSKSFDVKGLGKKKCIDLTTCELMFKDINRCVATCTGSKISC